MHIRILLSSYLLTYMYGDLVFHNIFLLTREVLKKAYNEGLYYISNEKNIDDIMSGNIQNRKRILAFSGIPTFEEVCMNLSPTKKISVLQINLSYESLASFTYKKEKEALIGFVPTFEDLMLTKKTLYLSYEEGKLCYSDVDNRGTLEDHLEDIIKYFRKEIENYKYAIENKINFLRKNLFEYLETETSKSDLEDEEKLKVLKESYEELMN